jgi:hypothetical protein
MKSALLKAIMSATALVVCSYAASQPEVQAETENENYISYLGADWGPDGNTIYFLKQVVLKQKTTGGLSGLTGGIQTRSSGIWFCKMKWDGSQKQEIAEMWPGEDASVDTQGGPVWMQVNAATSNIVFGIEYGMGTVGIWVMDLAGKNLHKPFEPVWNDQEKERVTHPSWSPDGRQLVYCRDSRELGIFDFKTDQRRRLTEGIRDLHPVWSPKGDWIAYTHYTNYSANHGDRYIWLIKPDGSEQKPIVDRKNRPVRGWWPSWNAEGTRVSIDSSGLLTLGSPSTNGVEWINPIPILGEHSPWLFNGHHWGKRGWLICAGKTITFIDSTDLKARLLGYGGIASVTSSNEVSLATWGPPPIDLQGKKTDEPPGGQR